MKKTKTLAQLLFCVSFFTLLIASSCRTEPKVEASQSATKTPSSLQMRLLAEPDGLSPIIARSQQARQVYRHLFTRLLEVNPITSEVIPQLAIDNGTEEVLENGNQKFTFNIHPKSSWSDGKPITVDDIIFSYKMLKHPGVKTRYSVIADLIMDIQSNPDNKTQISFIAGECHITLRTAICEMFIYPEHIFDPKGTLRDIPFKDFLDKEKISDTISKTIEAREVGKRFMDPSYHRDPSKFVTSGAYLFKEWTTGQRIVLQQNKDWWGNNINSPIFKNQAKEIQFQIIPDNNTAMTQLANGELDAIVDIPSPLYEEYKDKENLVAFETPAYQTIWLTLNTEKGILSDKNIRKALAYVCDEEAIIKNARDGYGNIVTGPFMNGTNEYNEKVIPTGVDIKKAQAILKDAGWKDTNGDGILDKIINGKKTKLLLRYNMTSKSTTGAIAGELLKDAAKQVGIEINILPKDSKTLRQMKSTGDFDIIIEGTGFSAGLYDPKGRWHTASFPPNGANYAKFGNKETDAIIDELRSTCDNDSRRTELYHQLHAIIAEEQPVIFLYNPKTLFLVNKRFDNIIVSPNRPGLFEEFLTLK